MNVSHETTRRCVNCGTCPPPQYLCTIGGNYFCKPCFDLRSGASLPACRKCGSALSKVVDFGDVCVRCFDLKIHAKNRAKEPLPTLESVNAEELKMLRARVKEKDVDLQRARGLVSAQQETLARIAGAVITHNDKSASPLTYRHDEPIALLVNRAMEDRERMISMLDALVDSHPEAPAADGDAVRVSSGSTIREGRDFPRAHESSICFSSYSSEQAANILEEMAERVRNGGSFEASNTESRLLGALAQAVSCESRAHSVIALVPIGIYEDVLRSKGADEHAVIRELASTVARPLPSPRPDLASPRIDQARAGWSTPGYDAADRPRATPLDDQTGDDIAWDAVSVQPRSVR